MKKLSGIPVSDGIAIGRVLKLDKEERAVEAYTICEEDIEKEISRFTEALGKVACHVQALYESTKQKLNESEAEIFAAHLSVIEDPMIEDGVKDRIRDERMNVEQALKLTLDEIEALFAALDDEYLRERGADVRDVGGQIMDYLLGNASLDLSRLPYPCIIAAKDLSPSETMSMDFSKTLGFMTEQGGRTSHTAIISRSLEVPAVVGTGAMMEGLKDEDWVILDALEGTVIINPDGEQITFYKQKQEEYLAGKQLLAQLKDKPAMTEDHAVFELCANIGSPSDADRILDYGAEGIGLYRTEFLYMGNSHFPTEEEQFTAYKVVAEKMGDKPVIIRTLDIGGDKELPYFTFEHEENPFLGWRAIRICLERVDVFKTQLRAILRASAFGNLRIMYPMIISKEELLQANEILEACKGELRSEGRKFNPDIQVGIMVETPAAVAMSEVLAKYADFFSIGTNDLCQYTLAVDRGNVKIAGRYNPLHPAVLRSIKKVIDAAHAQGKPVGMCGEFAGDERAAVLLAGFGLDEFSMTASSIPRIKRCIRGIRIEEARQTAAKVLEAETIEEVRQLIGYEK